MAFDYWQGMETANTPVAMPNFYRVDHPSNTYPNAVGHRGVSTSKAAAKDMEDRKGHLYELIVRAILAFGPMTPEEICARIGETRHSVAPRCTELMQFGALKPTGTKRQNISGKWARVLMISPEA